MSAAPGAKPVPVWPATLPPMPVVLLAYTLVKLPRMPVDDFALLGEVEPVPLPRHQKLVASFLSRNWAQIPHVTHHDEAEAPTLDTVRKALGEQMEEDYLWGGDDEYNPWEENDEYDRDRW